MSPDFLPLFILLMIGVFLAGASLHCLTRRKWGRSLKLGALSVVVLGIGATVGIYAARHSASTWRLPEAMRPRALSPELHPTSPSTEEPDVMTLVLGGVRIRVPTQQQYDLSISRQTFLTMESVDAGLLVSCDVAGAPRSDLRHAYSREPRVVAQISENTVTYKAPGVETERPNAYILVVKDGEDEALRVHHLDPRTVEVTGRLGLPPGVVQLQDGITWSGNWIPPGPLDLTSAGKGRIDFEPTGTVRIVAP